MASVDVKLVSCSVCGNIAFLGADKEDTFYLVCLVCQRVTPVTYMQEQVAKGNRLNRPNTRNN